jgi:hypothetical protein
MKLVGAQGFIPKAECAYRLLKGVEALLRGETFFKADSPNIGLPH